MQNFFSKNQNEAKRENLFLPRWKRKLLVLTENRYHVQQQHFSISCIFVPSQHYWSGNFRLNDFDGWQEKGSNFSFCFPDLRILWKSFLLTFVKKKLKHLFVIFVWCLEKLFYAEMPEFVENRNWMKVSETESKFVLSENILIPTPYPVLSYSSLIFLFLFYVSWRLDWRLTSFLKIT